MITQTEQRAVLIHVHHPARCQTCKKMVPAGRKAWWAPADRFRRNIFLCVSCGKWL